MSLAEHLERHRARLDTLIDLLDDERRLLGDGAVDGDGLARVAQAKQEQFQALERFETQRRQVQRRLGYDDDRAGDARAAAFGAEAPLLRELKEGAAVVRAYGRVGAAASRCALRRHVASWMSSTRSSPRPTAAPMY